MNGDKPAETPDPVQLNARLVQELKSQGVISTSQVEEAFRAVLRHHFLPEEPLEVVYSDRAIATKKEGQQWTSSSSQPAMMAIMLEQLQLEPGQRVLEIGAGTGYNAALMAYIVGPSGQVYSIDIADDLVQKARRNLAGAGYEQVNVLCSDGGYGYLPAGPYDRIILTAASAEIAPAWWGQLRPGGILVLPLELPGGQKSVAFERTGDHLVSRSIRDCGFMPLQGDYAARSIQHIEIGPEPGLFLEADHAVDRSVVYNWLRGPSQAFASGVTVSLREIFRGLRFWLGLREPQIFGLVARGDMVEREIVPPLMGLSEEWKSQNTLGVLSPGGMAVLSRPPGEAAPQADINNPFQADTPFPLYVRAYGADPQLAQRVIAQIQDWEAAGWPATDRLRLRAYRKEASYLPQENETLIAREHTHLVVYWAN